MTSVQNDKQKRQTHRTQYRLLKCSFWKNSSLISADIRKTEDINGGGAAFRTEFGFRMCPLKTPLGAEGIFKLVTHIN